MTRLILLAGALALAFPPPSRSADPPVRLPDPVAPTPLPVPATSGYVLAADELLVVDSDVELFVRTFPAGVLTVGRDAGPLRVRGKFIGGNGRTETKTFKGPFLYLVEAASAGKADLVLVPKGLTADDQIVTRTVEANLGPRPPPTPPGPTPPGPQPPEPAVTNPFGDLPGLRVLIVYDSANTTRPGPQQSILTGITVRDYLESHCAAGPADELDDRGQPMKEYRIFPDNSDVSAVRPVFRDTFAKRGGKDWLFVGNGKAGFSGPLPNNPVEALAVLKKYGGQ